ncbi:hypothetical protein GOODEAATRI_008012, partial [Goodea atripinnis]
EVFHDSAPQHFTFWEAKAYCVSHGAELATTAQLYAAWNDGLNHCSPGWLADRSVRYPIVTPRERCGGGEPGDNGPYTESPQDALTTELEDIGQDIVFQTTQEDATLSEATPEGRGEMQHAQATNLVKQVPETSPHTLTPLPDHDETFSTRESWELIKKESYSDSYQPAPKGTPNKDHEESHVFPTSSQFDAHENLTTTITSITSSGSFVPTEGQTSETVSLDWLAVNVTSEGDLEKIHHEESDLPVSEEDYSTDVLSKHVSVTEPAVSVIPQGDAARTVVQIPAVTTSSHTEEDNVSSTSLFTSLAYSTSDSPAEELSGEGTSDALAEDTQGSVTPSWMGMGAVSTSVVVPTSDSEPALQLYTRDEDINSNSNTTEPDDYTEQSGHIHPAVFQNVEVPLVSDKTYSSVDSMVLQNNPLTLLTSVSVTQLPLSVKVEISSSEIVTFHPDVPTLSEVEPVEEIQDKIDQDTLEENPEVFLNTVPNITEYNPDETGGDRREGADESSEETPHINPDLTVTSPTLSADHSADGNIGEGGSEAPPLSEIKITLIPHLSLTPRWEPEPSTPTAQESRSDREHSAEPPVNEKSEIFKEQEFTRTQSRTHGKFLCVKQLTLDNAADFIIVVFILWQLHGLIIMWESGI